MAQRTPTQLARRRRVERLIGVAVPLLDVLLAVGDRVSRVAGRNDVDPEPPLLGERGSRSRLGRERAWRPGRPS